MKDANEILNGINEKLECYSIGEKATSYKLPLIVEEIKDYHGLICIDTKNIKNKYLVFDKETFINAVNNYNKK